MHDQNSDTATPTKTLTKRKGDKGDTGRVIKKSKHCRASKAKWSPEEDDILSRAVMVSGEGNWKKIAQSLSDRSHLQCLHRWQKVLNPALVKGPWKEEEDAKLSELVEKYGPKDWSTIASHIPGRIGKQCRERWFNHLSPEVRKTNWTPEEDRIIIEAHSKIGNKWTNISKLLDGRPANAIKNHWNSTLLKRIQDSSGESAPRRDRTRTKKPLPLRATEFDYRTHLQADDTASECSPSQYQLSPSSSPEMPYHEPSKANTVRFHYPPHEANAQAFYNSFNEHNANIPASNSYTNTAWESWPAPNVIHLTPSAVPATTTPLSHSLLQNHILGQNMNSFNHLGAHHHGMEYTLGLIDPPTDELTELYTSTQHGTTLPVELQYCFGSPIGSTVTLPENYAPLSLENTGGVNMNGVNVNMGLLNLDLPTFCSLDM